MITTLEERREREVQAIDRGIKILGYDGLELLLDLLADDTPLDEIARQLHPYIVRQCRRRACKLTPSLEQVQGWLRGCRA